MDIQPTLQFLASTATFQKYLVSPFLSLLGVLQCKLNWVMDISSGLDISWVNYLSRILLSDLQVFLGLICHLTFSPLPPHPSFFLLLFCLFLLLLLDFMAKESLKVSWRGCWYLFILDLRTYSLILLWSSGLRGSMMIINMAIGDFVSLPFFPKY